MEDSGAIVQRTAFNRYAGPVEKEEWRWRRRRPGKPTCSPDGKPYRKVYYRMVLIRCSIRRGSTSVFLDGQNPPTGERMRGQAPLGAKKSVGPPLQIYRRMRRSLITITFLDTCRSMREHLMAITVSEVGKILTLICRSCACRRLEKVDDVILSLSLCRAYPGHR